MGKVNCLMCGCLSEQLFCLSCAPKGWQQYKAIQEFLRDYPGITLIEVCREMSVSLGFIKGLVEAGYLNLNLPKSETPPLNGYKPSGFHTDKNKK